MSTKKLGLGSNSKLGNRLGSLGLREKKIDEADKKEALSQKGTMELDIGLIVPNPHQPRQSFSEESLQELAQSICQYGMVQPLLVQRNDDGTYVLVAGERRLRAARLAGLKAVPAIERDYAPQEAAEIALIENLQREDLNAIEEATAYETLIEEFSLTQEAVSKKVGKSRPHIANMMRLLKLEPEVQQLLRDGSLSMGQARPLLQLTQRDMQLMAARRIVKDGFSARQCESLVKGLLQGKKKKETPGGDAYLESLEDQVKMHLGTNVSIRFNKDKKKGKIEIAIASEAELERLLSLLTDDDAHEEYHGESSFTI